MNTTAITAGGDFASYLQLARHTPPLSESEERACALAYRNHNDLEAARRLVFSHLRLVISTARAYRGYGLPAADLVQEGNVGLMKAVRRFDPSRGARLATFALYWIKAEIHEYIIRNWRIVKIATTKAQRKLFFNLRKLTAETLAKTGQAPEDEALAQQLDVKRDEVRQMRARFAAADRSLDAPARGHGEDEHGDVTQMADESETAEAALVRRAEQREARAALARGLRALPHRSRAILRRRRLHSPKATLHELADKYGVSAERIRQIEENAFAKVAAAVREQVAAPPRIA